MELAHGGAREPAHSASSSSLGESRGGIGRRSRRRRWSSSRTTAAAPVSLLPRERWQDDDGGASLLHTSLAVRLPAQLQLGAASHRLAVARNSAASRRLAIAAREVAGRRRRRQSAPHVPGCTAAGAARARCIRRRGGRACAATFIPRSARPPLLPSIEEPDERGL